jgi:hypothetical protein
MDVTEIFKDLEAEKRLRLIKLGFYLSLFIVVIFRQVVFSKLDPLLFAQ